MPQKFLFISFDFLPELEIPRTGTVSILSHFTSHHSSEVDSRLPVARSIALFVCFRLIFILVLPPPRQLSRNLYHGIFYTFPAFLLSVARAEQEHENRSELIE